MNHKSEAANLTRRTWRLPFPLLADRLSARPSDLPTNEAYVRKRINCSLSSIADNRYLKCSVFTKPDQIRRANLREGRDLQDLPSFPELLGAVSMFSN
jgi:hypothetical protein